VENKDHSENNRMKPEESRENANHKQQHAFFSEVA